MIDIKSLVLVSRGMMIFTDQQFYVIYQILFHFFNLNIEESIKPVSTICLTQCHLILFGLSL